MDSYFHAEILQVDFRRRQIHVVEIQLQKWKQSQFVTFLPNFIKILFSSGAAANELPFATLLTVISKFGPMGAHLGI